MRAQPLAGRDLPGAGAEVERVDKAIGAARAEVREHGAQTPPDYLRDAHYPGAQALGRGIGYRYAHDEPGGVADQQLLPDALADRRFYEPTDRGFEAELGSGASQALVRFEIYLICGRNSPAEGGL